ncbi:alpha/beta fold hydrolase [Streptomyces noursei]|uniref:alpha/beta fold hydrolase n=1 Tax=Streptomyces noursei TaxID=1971 RepID=UPI0021556EEF|nr:alpha/beta hydrolase [Streptomyces noursei]
MLHVRDHGGDGPPLVLLHGAGRSLADWDASAAVLTAEHRVLAVDLPGHGRSPDISAWAVSGVLRGIEDVLEARGVPEAIPVGTSLGGLVAVEYARRHRDRTPAAVDLDGFWWGKPGQYPGSEKVGEQLRAAAGVLAPPDYIEQQIAHAGRYGIPPERAEAQPVAPCGRCLMAAGRRCRSGRRRWRCTQSSTDSARPASPPGWKG